MATEQSSSSSSFQQQQQYQRPRFGWNNRGHHHNHHYGHHGHHHNRHHGHHGHHGHYHGHHNPNNNNLINSTGTRIIRSLTFENRDFLPRPFQIELYEACKNRDTIVFLRPGQGKYFISVMLVKYFSPHKLPSNIVNSNNNNNIITLPFEDNHEERKIFFLTKSTNSIKLYSSVFDAHSDLRIGEYLNLEQAKKWSEEQWKKQLKSFDIHLMLDELFEYLLDRKFINEDNIKLLVLDDVHKILLPSPNNLPDCYTRIVRKLKSSSTAAKNDNENDSTTSKHYRILGLSASILLEDVSAKIFEKMIEQIESDLGCSCETYADLRMINKYSIQSRIKIRVYPPLMPKSNADIINNEKEYKFSLFMIRNYSAQFFQFILNFSSSKSSINQKDQIIDNDSIASIILDILEVYGKLGEWCALKLIELVQRELFDTITLLSKTESNYLRLLNVTYTTLRLIKQSILNYLKPDLAQKLIEQQSEKKLSLEEFLLLSAPKLHLLAHVLHDYLQELNNRSSTISNSNTNYTPHSTFIFPGNICALIYCENRSMARVLNEWLKELAVLTKNSESNSSLINLFSYLLPDYVFLAENDCKNEMKNFYYRKHQKSLHEIYYYRKQEETLKKFRLAHNCNILITTSMSAEGLDINRCNLVICFDPIQTFYKFIQSKGRVRVEKGQFIVFVEETIAENYINKFLEFVNIEKIFTKLVPLNNQVQIEHKPNIIKFIGDQPQPKLQEKEPESPQQSQQPQQQENLEKVETIKESVESVQKPQSIDTVESSTNQKSVPNNNNNKVGSMGQTATTTIQLTLDNAIPLLNRYCNKLPSDTFTKLVPNYKIEHINQIDDVAKFRCRLYLPINSTYRDEIIGEPQLTQSLAKQSAAMQAVKLLKEIGELDQNFYPIGKETSRYIEKLGLQDCFINTNNVQANTNTGNSTTAPTSTTAATPTTTMTTATPNTYRPHNQQQQQQGFPHPKGNRYNRIQNRNIASKRRQYYNKKVAESLRGDVFKYDSERKCYYYQYLYQFDMKLTYRLSEKQNNRGRKIIDPAETTRMFGIISPNYLPPICDFTIYNRSGEVTISLQPLYISNCGNGIEISEEQIRAIENFHQYTFENVLPLGKSSLNFDVKNASNGNYLIVPIDLQKNNNENGEPIKSIDWEFINRIWQHSHYPNQYDESIFRYDEQNRFIFEEQLYKDAVVIPKYRKDKLQAFYYVAEICKDLTPLSPFPDGDFESFEEYYRIKYGKQITNLEQPLLDVDHTSARLNLLTPRFLNRRGLPITNFNQSNDNNSKNNNGKHHHSKRSPQQKQILVPELCYIHPFPASFWRKAVGLPCILYRLNLLLIAEELRFKIAKEANIGVTDLPEGKKWSKLDFGWSALVERARLQQENFIENNIDVDEKVDDDEDLEKEFEGRQLKSDIIIVNRSVDSTNNSDPSSPTTTATIEPVKETEKSNNDNDDNANANSDDPFAVMDDWTSFSATIPQSNEKNEQFDDDDYIEDEELLAQMVPKIDIISGPFSNGQFSIPPDSSIINNEQYSEQEYDGDMDLVEEEIPDIVEVDDKGDPIQIIQPTNETKEQQPVRAGSPTYWQKCAQMEKLIEKKKSDIYDKFNWTNYDPKVSICDFSINLDELTKEISDLIARKDQFEDNKFSDDDYDDFKIDPEDCPEDQDQKQQQKWTKNSNKRKRSKPLITSLSDLDDDDEEDDGNNTSYSDFDLDDSSDEDDLDDFFDDDLDEDDELLSDVDDDYGDDNDDEFENQSGQRRHHRDNSNRNNYKNKRRLENLSQTMNAYQMKSVIYDVLEIELMYDPKQIEQKILKNYYRHRFALADQEPEHLRKRKLFDEMYRTEKQQVLECVRHMSKNAQEDILQKLQNLEENYQPEAEFINPDKNLNEIDLNETLIKVLMKKIDSSVIESFKLERSGELNDDYNDNYNYRLESEQELPLSSSTTTATTMDNLDTNKKIEVKFGELLPNRDQVSNNENNINNDIVDQNDDDDLYQKQAKLINLERERASKNLPYWLKTDLNDNSGETENNDDNLGPHPNLILQAITMSNSSDGINLERLETVGDSFLKYSITAFLFCMCPELNEGKLSFLRSRQISNINLHRLGQQINLGQLMIASKFEPVDNWCPPSYQVLETVENTTTDESNSNTNTNSNNKKKSNASNNNNNNKVPYNLLTQHSIPNKSLADCVEALIGTYLISSGSQGAIQFMDWLGLKVLPKKMKIITKDDSNTSTISKDDNNKGVDESISSLNREKWLPQPKSPLIIPKHWKNNRLKIKEIESKLQETYYKHHLDRFEEIIGYKFKDRAYLVQAFTHNSYYENTVTDCYQRLEFLGDAVLDYLITRYLYEDPRCHSPGTLTDLRSALVNNTFFAALAVKYSFHKYLMMLSSELYRVIDGFVRKFNIHYNSNNGINGNNGSIVAGIPSENHNDDGEEDHDNNEMDLDKFSDDDNNTNNNNEFNYWELFISENEAEHLEDIEVPKALGDIFESVAGAIYLDSGMSLEAVWKAYYPMMKPEIENFSDKVPKSPIRVLLENQPQSVKFGKPEINSGRRIRVTAEVFGLGKFVGIGRNKRIAKCTAAKRALRALESEKRRKELEQQKRLQQQQQY